MKDNKIKDQIHTGYKIGLNAEKEVCKLLESKGLSIIKNRYKTKNGEIDIIALDSINNIVVFCEVKCRKKIFDYINLISPKQLKRINNTIEDFLIDFPEYMSCNCRIDSFYIDKTSNKIEVVENFNL